MADTTTTLTAPGSGDLVVRFAGAATDYTANLARAVVAGETRTIGTAADLAAAGDLRLGPVAAGDPLTFSLVQNGTGPVLSGADHLRIRPNGDGTWSVAFEDLTAAQRPDFDFDDLQVVALVVQARPDWDAIAADVLANLGATGQWGATPGYAPAIESTVVDWNALAASAEAAFAATGHWFIA
jgi:hypothetical protein